MAIFAAINLLVTINAIVHHPKIGYDVVDNITYIQILSHRLPRADEIGEFFSPPLPFFLPSIYDRICVANDTEPLQRFAEFYISWSCRTKDGKFAQALNVLLSVGTTLLLLGIAQLLKPNNRFFKLSILILLANLTVYYKTFAQVRGEPYVVFFSVLSAFLVIQLMRSTSFDVGLISLTGISLGCLILSRQWGFFIYPALGLVMILVYVRDRQEGVRLIKQLVVSGAIGLLIGGFFYFHLYMDYGSFSAFNIKEPAYPSWQQAYKLLRKTHLGNFELFQTPVRPAFTGAILPILYSETWGDYWGYFTYIKANSSYGENGIANSETFVTYLGRANLVSIPTTLILFCGVLTGVVQILRFPRSGGEERKYALLIALITLTMLLGFSWFVYSYVLASTKVLKATYMLQGLVFLVVPAAAALEKLRIKWSTGYSLVIVILAAAFVHNIPAMITRYNVFAFWQP